MKTLARVVPGLVAATALLVVPSAAHAAAAKPVSLKTSYSCSTAAGTGRTAITVRTTIPRSVKHGAKVGARSITASIVLPKATVDALRAYGVTSIKGSAKNVSFTVGTKKVPLTGLAIPRTEVPSSGTMTLKGSGSTTAFRIRRAGVYTVFVPSSIDGTVVATRSSGAPISSPLDCSIVKKAPHALTTLKVTR